ncbi:hypothetical protein [Bdellovibrio sp. HCB2-146]|uniref:hypothetical protein n=1 Tax=Bdellovibrio sp. HCB2-146 TaxID=3394362 RepID=UPI0039BCA4DF
MLKSVILFAVASVGLFAHAGTTVTCAEMSAPVPRYVQVNLEKQEFSFSKQSPGRISRDHLSKSAPGIIQIAKGQASVVDSNENSLVVGLFEGDVQVGTLVASKDSSAYSVLEFKASKISSLSCVIRN